VDQEIKAQDRLFETFLSWQTRTLNDFFLKSPKQDIHQRKIAIPVQAIQKIG
jgi:hypothetical protein